ncbi:hypothetical protein OG897_24110 [Streptomyces sp. NBC_00237]|uniref:hypothetical protein n=1 Tax=Streptomyces sp. NBC_00237 TaxID=2975687 RepID=UPI00225079DB|nr:hypothetical protein [Streptomyces sp. NBC_00237]MCX5204527.1 hypothetical protein [Streptomyces sp. NBC_00237]
MADIDTEWRLLHGGDLIGTITVDDIDMPWYRGRFLPERGFGQFKRWFDEVNVLVGDADFGGFEAAYDRIEHALTLLSPHGPVAEFLLHIDQERAWFRWDGVSVVE